MLGSLSPPTLLFCSKLFRDEKSCGRKMPRTQIPTTMKHGVYPQVTLEPQSEDRVTDTPSGNSPRGGGFHSHWATLAWAQYVTDARLVKSCPTYECLGKSACVYELKEVLYSSARLGPQHHPLEIFSD